MAQVWPQMNHRPAPHPQRDRGGVKIQAGDNLYTLNRVHGLHVKVSGSGFLSGLTPHQIRFVRGGFSSSP